MRVGCTTLATQTAVPCQQLAQSVLNTHHSNPYAAFCHTPAHQQGGFDAGAYSFFGDMAPLDEGLGGALEVGLRLLLVLVLIWPLKH